jgi:hypothetical protein
MLTWWFGPVAFEYVGQVYRRAQDDRATLATKARRIIFFI